MRKRLFRMVAVKVRKAGQAIIKPDMNHTGIWFLTYLAKIVKSPPCYLYSLPKERKKTDQPKKTRRGGN